MGSTGIDAVARIIAVCAGVRILPIRCGDLCRKNRLAEALAAILARKFRIDIDDAEIVQANRPRRPGTDGSYRFSVATRFVGRVDPGKYYLLVDGIVDDDSRIADLVGYIVKHGGHVSGLVCLVWAVDWDPKYASDDDEGG